MTKVLPGVIKVDVVVVVVVLIVCTVTYQWMHPLPDRHTPGNRGGVESRVKGELMPLLAGYMC